MEGLIAEHLLLLLKRFSPHHQMIWLPLYNDTKFLTA